MTLFGIETSMVHVLGLYREEANDHRDDMGVARRGGLPSRFEHRLGCTAKWRRVNVLEVASPPGETDSYLELPLGGDTQRVA